MTTTIQTNELAKQEAGIKAREQRGMFIAATCLLTRKGENWLVPSQTGTGKYTVTTNRESPTCTCPDYDTTGKKCKHIFAVEFASKREQQPDGSTKLTETVVVTEKRKTYPQVWRYELGIEPEFWTKKGKVEAA